MLAYVSQRIAHTAGASLYNSWFWPKVTGGTEDTGVTLKNMVSETRTTKLHKFIALNLQLLCKFLVPETFKTQPTNQSAQF